MSFDLDVAKYKKKLEASKVREKVFIHKKLETIFKAIVSHSLDRPFVVVFGGRGSTKSTSFGGVWANLFSFEDDFRVLYSRFTATSIKASTQLDFEDGMKLMGISPAQYSKSDYMYTNKDSGSKVLLKGLKGSQKDMDGNNKSLKDFNVWICDEATDIPDLKTFQTISQSIRVVGKPNYKILILNPSHKNHWIYNEFFTPEGVFYDLAYRIKINYTDVERFLSSDFIREAEEVKKKNITLYNNMYLGDWRDKVDGAVFDYFIKPFPENSGLTMAYGQDFGFTDSFNATVKVAVDFHAKTIYLKEKAYFNRTGTDQMSEILFKVTDPRIPIIADTAGRQTIEDLIIKGHNIDWLKKPSVDFSVTKMKDYIIYVDPNSPNLIRELDMYHEKNGIIKRENDHAIDAARYGFWWLINM